MLYFLHVRVREIRSVVSDCLQFHGLYSQSNSLGQNTGVGSLSLLQVIFPIQESNQGLLHCRWILYQLSYQGSPLHVMHAKSLQSCLTLCDPMGSSPPGSPVHGILQARIVGCHFLLHVKGHTNEQYTFLKKLFIQCIFVLIGSCCRTWAFSTAAVSRVYSSCDVWASHYGGKALEL